jgi:hypothetical protein
MMSAERFTEVLMNALNDTFPIVHVLRGSFPLCGFTLAHPESWPPGHKWVSFRDLEVHTKTTCEDCKDLLREERS